MKGNFQIIILVIFIAFAIFSVFVFSGAIPIGEEENTATGTVVLWGTVKSSIMSSLLEDFNEANPTFVLKYVQKSADTFDNDLLEALAEGNGPDLFFISDDLAFKYRNKIYPISYQNLTIDSFKTNFVSVSEVFLTTDGILAFPLTIDPMMMYYNRSILDANGIVSPPTYWEELIDLVPVLTKKDEESKLLKSAVAMGQFSNISHAKDILTTLFMQTGSSIVAEEEGGTFVSVLKDNISKYKLNSVLEFYTNFANPLNNLYSWNRSFPDSGDAFSAEDLAFYFGYASELQSLIKKNPNQDFLITSIPQIKNSNFKLTFGRVMGVAISSSSKNLNTAFTAASLLAKSDFVSALSTSLGIAPSRRDLFKTMPTDAYLPTFYTSALFAKTWPDPSTKDTDDIFKGMIEKVLSNSMDEEGAITDANAKLNLLLRK